MVSVQTVAFIIDDLGVFIKIVLLVTVTYFSPGSGLVEAAGSQILFAWFVCSSFTIRALLWTLSIRFSSSCSVVV